MSVAVSGCGDDTTTLVYPDIGLPLDLSVGSYPDIGMPLPPDLSHGD